MSDDMMKDNMSDFEIRVLGRETAPGIPSGDTPPASHRHVSRRLPRHVVLWTLLCVVLLSAVAVGAWMLAASRDALPPGGLPAGAPQADTLSVETLPAGSLSAHAYVSVSDTTVNDIPLRVMTPVGGHVGMYVGHRPAADAAVILAAHAADLRDDDGTPAGAFVYNGELLSRGRSKLGFCAIVGKTVSIGRQAETPLFESAVEQDGCFFRQYSLVSNGRLQPIPPKGKALRRALCLKDGTLHVVSSLTPESYHDFSLALEDIGVSEAIALVGGTAAVMWRDRDGNLAKEGESFGGEYPYENYIVWRKTAE
ncbi:MAG: phosphodiester glycosidase family protein [Prevotella sp.]